MTDTVHDPSTMDADRAVSALPAHHGCGAGPRAIVFEFNVPMQIDVLVELSQQYRWDPGLHHFELHRGSCEAAFPVDYLSGNE